MTQAFADPSRAAAARSQKVLEINPRCAHRWVQGGALGGGPAHLLFIVQTLSDASALQPLGQPSTLSAGLATCSALCPAATPCAPSLRPGPQPFHLPAIMPDHSACLGQQVSSHYTGWTLDANAQTRNCRHPLIRGLKERVAESDEPEESTTELGHLLFDAALLESGFVPENAKSFTARVQVRARTTRGARAQAHARNRAGMRVPRLCAWVWTRVCAADASTLRVWAVGLGNGRCTGQEPRDRSHGLAQTWASMYMCMERMSALAGRCGSVDSGSVCSDMLPAAGGVDACALMGHGSGVQPSLEAGVSPCDIPPGAPACQVGMCLTALAECANQEQDNEARRCARRCRHHPEDSNVSLCTCSRSWGSSWVWTLMLL